MDCSVSSEVPEQPVISPVSGHVFEKRLILKYLNEKGTDPVNNEALSPEQLIELKGRHTFSFDSFLMDLENKTV